MRKRVLIAVVAGFLSIGASGAWADETVNEQGISAPEQLGLPALPEGWKATPHHRVHKGGVAPGLIRPEFITGWGYTPSQIRDAYGFNLLPNWNDGTGQRIAIVVACGSPTIDADLAAFSAAYGLPPANLVKHNYPFSTTQPSLPPTCPHAGWAMETSLDVEWVHALAPGATIDLMIAPTAYGSDLFYAEQYAWETLNDPVITMSWGGPEFSSEAQLDRWFLQHQGTVFIASSGDMGSGTLYPAASRNVVAVGGTALYLDVATTPVTLKWPEVAWERSGGGASKFVAKPSYQTAFGVSSINRCIPDVAFAADSYTGVRVYDSNYDPGTGDWWIVGGTSLSAPCWAAIVALADQLRARNFRAPLTDGHQALYTLAGSSAGYNVNGCYRDITWGFNGNYAARTGYDFITGLGSPMVNVLVPALAASQ